jgi:hypothetical protein
MTLPMEAMLWRRCMTVVLDEADHLMSDSFVDIVRFASGTLTLTP